MLVLGAAAPGCASPGAVDRRATHSAAVAPGDGVAWIEATILVEAVVKAEARERALRMGFGDDEAGRRSEQDWQALNGKAEGGPVLEVWLSTTCDGCLDLRRWSWSLVGERDGISCRPRWTESEVMRQQEEVRTVLDVSRTLTRSWVRGRLAFARGDVPSEGRVDLHIARPERWAAPVVVTWWRGGLSTGERAQAWLAGAL